MKVYFRYIKYVLTFALMFPLGVYAQEEFLVSIDGKKYSVEDFLYIYNKNNEDPLPGDVNAIKNELDRFINYKLEIIDAENSGFAHTPEFQNEFAKYKKLLADPFLLDNEKFNQLILQAYQRLKNEVRVQHIFISSVPWKKENDTLALDKVNRVLMRLAESEQFKYVAESCSDDLSAAVNGGDLWYIKTFDLPYSVENYVYSEEPGKFSKPIQTNDGYHLVKIISYRKNPGMIKVAHILFSLSENAKKEEVVAAKNKADDVYRMLLTGSDFSELAVRYSDDVGLSDNGVLPWFGTGEMEHEFETACVNLRVGEISRPVRTKYGWHIIKKIAQQSLPEYDFIKDQLIRKIKTNDRFAICQKNIIDKTKEMYGFKDFGLKQDVYDMVDSSLIFEGKWKVPPMIMSHEVLFKIGNKEFNKQSFATFLAENQKKQLPYNLIKYVDLQYLDFQKKMILDYAYDKLYETSAEYRRLVNIFKDGILLFAYLNDKVWKPSQTDTVALKKYYRQNLKKYNKYGANISVFEYASDMDMKKLKKYFLKYKKQHIKDELLAKVIKKSTKKDFIFINRYNASEEDELFAEVIRMYLSDNLPEKQKMIILPDKNKVVYLNTPLTRISKHWTEYKNELIFDYQKWLENNLIQQLRKKYSIKINEKTLQSLIY